MSGESLSWLLVSDIDDTLTGDEAALQKLAVAINAAKDRLIFAVNSSRPAASVAETLRKEFPPSLVPAAVITALGTEIAVGGEDTPDWQTRFAGWPHGTVFDILSSLGHMPHDPVFQTPLKVSFAVPAGEPQAQAREALHEAGIACEIIASGTDDFDVIPKGAGKAAATLFLASHFGVDQARLIVAGDSGNDLAMFKAAQNRIAVGNARQELIQALEVGSFYHAQQPHAAGVHEGLCYYGVIPDPNRER